MSQNFNGVIIAVEEVRTGISKGTGQEWASQNIVVEESGEAQYPQSMVFTIFGKDKIESINPQINEFVNVFFNAKAREYNGKHFCQLSAWKIEKDNNSYNNTQGPVIDTNEEVTQTKATKQVDKSGVNTEIEKEDDLPF